MMPRDSTPPIQPAEAIAAIWRYHCGENRWTKALDRFGRLGGLCRYWSGVPGSRSAIPLTFALFAPDGHKLPCDYRLKDIHAAIKALENPS